LKTKTEGKYMARFAKEAEAIRKGAAVDLKAFIEEKREKPSEDGELYANVSNVLHDALANATEVKDKDGRVTALETPDIVAQISLSRIKQKTEGSTEDSTYEMEYVEFLAKTATGRLILVPGNNDDLTYEGEGDDRTEVPSVTRYFNQGFKVLAANAARARLVGILEGPDKAMLKAAENLAKAKGWTVEKAMQKVKAMMED
jgi:hypothetical protein